VKGIILAGGNGSRLWPITKSISKQLLPVYDKPLIYYPLSTLLIAGINEILIITKPNEVNLFQDLLGDGSDLGIEIAYEVQRNPNGLAEAFIIGEKFIGNSKVSLILGDNIFYGPGLGRSLRKNVDISGAKIFAYHVSDPERYGVVEVDTSGKPRSIVEKPQKFLSHLAGPGLYFYDNSVVERAKNLKPSSRGELEITDLNLSYLVENKLQVDILQRGTAWLDTGTFESLNDASNYVKTIEDRQNQKIACIEEISYLMGRIDKNRLNELAKKYKNSPYAKYLENLVI
jgi:glucose-1-phosphate thymidylyltransferase